MSASSPIPGPFVVASSDGSAVPRPRKRFVGSTSRPSKGKRPLAASSNHVPEDILNNLELNEAIKALPANYSFEIHKTIAQLRQYQVKTVALQLPEGLLIYGPVIADILESFTSPPVQPLLLADVTYGACCIDDYTAKSMGAEMIVHYGHSCLIPVSQTTLRTLYVFVEIQVDPLHLSLSVRRNFPSQKDAFRRDVLKIRSEEALAQSTARIQIGIDVISPPDSSSPGLGKHSAGGRTKLALVSTIQFISAVQDLRDALSIPLAPIASDGDVAILPNPSSQMITRTNQSRDSLLRMKAEEIGVWRGDYDVVVPQVRPLSPGEVLGCTAPKLDDDVDALIYIGDGRFHLESIMIANPSIPAFRYDPYDKKFTREGYEHEDMRRLRGESIKRARSTLERSSKINEGHQLALGSTEGELVAGNEGARGWSVILGTLGRQGSLSVLKTITSSLPPSQVPPYLLLLSELSPQKLDLLSSDLLTTFVQTSCPRLSIDWGYAFSRPLLSPYEASVAIGRIQGWKGLDLGSHGGSGDYPMDFYSDDSLGPWTPRYGVVKPKKV